jgi:hypothetical protein
LNGAMSVEQLADSISRRRSASGAILDRWRVTD